MFYPITMGGVSQNPYAILTEDQSLGTRSGNPLVGIEVEVELDRATLDAPATLELEGRGDWARVADHSLRNHGQYQGWEYVSRPVTSEAGQLRSLLSQLEPVMEGRFDTPRAGVHVHVNCKPLVAPEFIAGLFAYYMLEPAIYQYVGGGREQNIFCVPLREELNAASNLCRAIGRVMVRSRPGDSAVLSGAHFDVREAISQAPKYLGLGLHTLGIHGTVESRHMVTPSGERWNSAIRSVARLMAALFAPMEHELVSETALLSSVLWRMDRAASTMRSTFRSNYGDDDRTRYQELRNLSHNLALARIEMRTSPRLEGWLNTLDEKVGQTPLGQTVLAGAPLLIETLTYIDNL